ncbi:hypothetical protein ACFVGY_11860 [Streptomyces sp. NPDC127106]|uniref:hypothetical protein n=1 Tax=Streptomyces sp. NPDC127106 TaxID=3345360 RepID=UPI00363D17D1
MRVAHRLWASARERGRHGGRPKAVDHDMDAYTRALRTQNVPVPEIARKRSPRRPHPRRGRDHG